MPLQSGKGLTLREGKDVTIAVTGSLVGRYLVAADKLAKEGIRARFGNALDQAVRPRFDFPSSRSDRRDCYWKEHSIIGGLGGVIAETLSTARPTILERVAIVDTFARTGLDPETMWLRQLSAR